MVTEKRVEFIGSIIIFFALLFVYSKWGPAIPFSTITQSKGEPMMVTETGKATVVPDVAIVTIGIESQGQSLKQVQNEVNTKSKSLTDSLKKLGVDGKDIKTTNYNVNPEYDYQLSPYKINGYKVSTNYEVKINNFDNVNEALTIATRNGANIIGNISFEVSDKIKFELTQKAREEAVKLAKEKAEGLAKASGISLGKIINISESTNSNYPMPVVMYDTKTANVTPGETEITVTVTLSYSL